MRPPTALLGAWIGLAGLQAPTFRTGVEAVRVDVLVTDGNRPVADLTADHFELRDHGVVQRLHSVTTGVVPVSMMLVLDTSESVEGEVLERLKEASRAAVAALAGDDHVALLTFSSAVNLRFDWGPPRRLLTAVIDEVAAGGATALYDAAFAALVHRDPESGRRTLVVLFSDDGDTASWLPREAVIDKARRTDAVVFSVNVGPLRREAGLQKRSGVQLRPRPPGPAFGPFVNELADLTGGDTVIASGAGELRAAFVKIVTGFRSRYVLTYTPDGVDVPGWHPIEVRLKGARGTVTARRGYSR